MTKKQTLLKLSKTFSGDLGKTKFIKEAVALKLIISDIFHYRMKITHVNNGFDGIYLWIDIDTIYSHEGSALAKNKIRISQVAIDEDHLAIELFISHENFIRLGERIGFNRI